MISPFDAQHELESEDGTVYISDVARDGRYLWLDCPFRCKDKLKRAVDATWRPARDSWRVGVKAYDDLLDSELDIGIRGKAKAWLDCFDIDDFHPEPVGLPASAMTPNELDAAVDQLDPGDLVKFTRHDGHVATVRITGEKLYPFGHANSGDGPLVAIDHTGEYPALGRYHESGSLWDRETIVAIEQL